jgi:hypothetical protein
MQAAECRLQNALQNGFRMQVAQNAGCIFQNADFRFSKVSFSTK